MQRMPRSVYLVLIFLVGLAVYWVIRPQEPEELNNKPSQTLEVKFVEKRALRVSLGQDAEMRLAIFAEGPTRRMGIPVVCPRGFSPDPDKAYVVDAYNLRDEDGNIAAHPVWILRYQLLEKPQYGLTP